MKTARLIKTNPSGTRNPQDEVVLVCTREEVTILCQALDLYCTQHPETRIGKELFHSFGWNYQEYMVKPKEVKS